jgi:hypothetical protein
MQELTRIIEDCENDADRKAALQQLRRTHRMLDVLVDETVKANAPLYEAATAALADANKALTETQRDIAKVAGAVEKAAKALGVVGKLADALA